MADTFVASLPEDNVVETPSEETDLQASRLAERKADSQRDQQPSTKPAEDSAATPTKRQRSSGSGTTARNIEKVVVEKLGEVCCLEPRTEAEVEGHMVELYDSKPRGDSDWPRSVLTLCLADETFVVSVTLWSPSVERYEEQLTKAMDSCSEAEFPFLKIKCLEVVRAASDLLPLCKVQSRRETTNNLAPHAQEPVADHRKYAEQYVVQAADAGERKHTAVQLAKQQAAAEAQGCSCPGPFCKFKGRR